MSAELALGFVGAAIAPGLGATALTGFQIGVTAGALLFPPEGPKLDQGRVDEIRLQSASQGTPIAVVYGRNRLSGTIIWTTGITESSATSTVGGKGGGGSQVTNYTYTASLAVVICEGTLTKVRRIYANEKVIYDWRTGASPVYAEYLNSSRVRIYLGNQTTADAAIEADKGVGNVPAHKGLAYVVFDDLNLSEFGNLVPNFTFEVESNHANLQVAMEDLAGKCGLSATDYDFTALASYPTRGMVINARTEGARIMEAFAKANLFELVESQGKIKAVIRNGVSVATIPADDIGAAGWEDTDANRYVETIRAEETELPREFTVAYQSEAGDFQAWTQVARRTTRWSENQEQVNFPMALTDNYARFLADAFLMEAWAARARHTFTLPYEYLFLDPGDVITIPDEGGGTRTVRILEMSMGLLAQIEVVAIDDDPIIYVDPGLPATVPPTPTSSIPATVVPKFWVFETVAPFDSWADQVYLGIAAAKATGGWTGGIVQADRFVWENNSIKTNQLAIIDSQCTIGFTSPGITGNAIPEPGGFAWYPYMENPDRLDTVNTVDVTVTYGTLSSCTYDELVRDGRNLCLVGRELLQFQTATFLGGTEYRLSNLLRFRRGTAYPTYSSLEPFILFNSKVKSFELNPTEVDQTLQARLLEYGVDYATLPTFRNYGYIQGYSRRPLAPTNPRYTGSRLAGSANVTLAWTRRARVNADMIDGTDVPWDEPTAESYRLTILSDDGSSILAIYYPSSSSFVYTVAMQVADGTDVAEFQFYVEQLTSFPGLGQGTPSVNKYVYLRDDFRY